jgi:lipid-A-disaccharide synthase
MPGEAAHVGAAPRGGVLLTAFEPSGDEHAAPLIAELRRRRPRLPIAAWGGPRMQHAGAALIERTGEAAVMGLPGPRAIFEHRAILRRIRRWIDEHAPDILVAVDSPAANFPLCAHARRRGMRVVHLVAPQVWAWGVWRVGKLRRRTDLVLCLLPFEQDWLRARGIPAMFIGHPRFDSPLDLAPPGDPLPAGSPRIALFPGSRPGEIARNLPVLLDTFRALRAERPGTAGVLGVTSAGAERVVRRLAESGGGWPDALAVAVARTDAIVHWCDLALVVSGTATLQVARQGKPMVAVYKSSRLLYHLVGRWIVRTRFFTLPNLIADREVIPEFVPHFGGAEPILREARAILDSQERRDAIRRGLEDVVRAFTGLNAASTGADQIERFLDLPPVPGRAAIAPVGGAGS